MNQSLAQKYERDDAVIEQMKAEQYRKLSAMDRIGELSAHIVCQLLAPIDQETPVVDVDGRWWTFDDIQQAVDKDPEVARLSRMLVLATTDAQRARAASAYQLVFRRTAKTIADDLAMGFYMNVRAQRHRSDAIN